MTRPHSIHVERMTSADDALVEALGGTPGTDTLLSVCEYDKDGMGVRTYLTLEWRK